MFCPKCGSALSGNEEFCPTCGNNIKTVLNSINTEVQNTNNTEVQKIVSQTINNSQTLTDRLATKGNSLIKPIIEKLKAHKKIVLIVIACIILAIVAFVLYGVFFSFEKLNWNEEYSDYGLSLISKSNIKLGIDFSDQEKAKDIKVKTSCGKATYNNLEVDWDLTDALGKCKVVVSYKLKKIKKEYNVVDFSEEKDPLTMDYEIDYDSDEDLDKDGLTNKDEKELKTNPEFYDTDMDGISDGDEINVRMTDPLKADTDSDGINDGDELDLGLDPLKEDSMGDGVKDGQRSLSYNISDDKLGVWIEATGKGNIASTYFNAFKNKTFANTEGLLDTVYNFYTEGKLENATVKIKYSVDELVSAGLNEDNLTLYYFNEDTKKLDAVETSIDKENKILTATLNHFSKYVVGDNNLVVEEKNNNVLFVIDNSVSMYSESQMIEAGYEESSGAIGNDVDFKRLSLTNKMIDMFTGNYKFASSEFSGNYVKLNEFTNSTDIVKKAVNTMKNNWNSNANGTNIIDALNYGINEFKHSDESNYLILLTDGKNTEGNLSNSSSNIIDNAKENNVKICVIGLGEEIDTVILDAIAEETGCDYYSANNASALDEIYAIVGADINYNQVDTDEDGKTDSTLLADSGFIVTRDGFPFENYVSTIANGHCHGMAVFAELYYLNKLPIKQEAKTVQYGPLKKSSYGYNLDFPFFKNHEPLYNYKFETEVFKIYIEGNYPKEIYELKDNNIMFKESYITSLTDNGLFTLEYKTPDTSKADLEKKYGFSYDEYQNISTFNEEKLETSSNIAAQDKQLINAILHYFNSQFSTHTMTSSMGGFQLIEDLADIEEIVWAPTANNFISFLSESLASGDPIAITVGGIHTINAIDLSQDNEDSNLYHIGVYDNNYPGKKRYLDMRCGKLSCKGIKNDYFQYKRLKDEFPIITAISLDETLRYID